MAELTEYSAWHRKHEGDSREKVVNPQKLCAPGPLLGRPLSAGHWGNITGPLATVCQLRPQPWAQGEAELFPRVAGRPLTELVQPAPWAPGVGRGRRKMRLKLAFTGILNQNLHFTTIPRIRVQVHV